MRGYVNSERPNRIFEATLAIAKAAGLGGERVLDSSALYDAVATQDAVTLFAARFERSLRRLISTLGAQLRQVLEREEDEQTRATRATNLLSASRSSAEPQKRHVPATDYPESLRRSNCLREAPGHWMAFVDPLLRPRRS